MTPITSIHDVRLVTLIGVAMNTIESLALETDVNPEQLLAEAMYMSNKCVHELGEQGYIERLSTNYPLLSEAIK